MPKFVITITADATTSNAIIDNLPMLIDCFISAQTIDDKAHRLLSSVETKAHNTHIARMTFNGND